MTVGSLKNGVITKQWCLQWPERHCLLQSGLLSCWACSAIPKGTSHNVVVRIPTCNWNLLFASERQHCIGGTGVDWFVDRLTTRVCKLCRWLTIAIDFLSIGFPIWKLIVMTTPIYRVVLKTKQTNIIKCLASCLDIVSIQQIESLLHPEQPYSLKGQRFELFLVSYLEFEEKTWVDFWQLRVEKARTGWSKAFCSVVSISEIFTDTGA